MTDWSNFVVGQFIGGRALFWGLALCLLGCSVKSFSSRTWVLSVARITILAGAVVVVLSATPFPLWVYGLFFALLALAAFRPATWRWKGRKIDALLLALLLAQCLVMAAIEILHSTPPKIPLPAGDTLFVIGDSLSIGADPPGKPWPELLGDRARLKVRNLGFGGATVATSLDNTTLIDQDDALVILEIGGNDLLGGTGVAEFRRDLETMLARVCRPNRRVVMIELPLPPFYNRFGRVQRELARSHGVTLVPKRYPAAILCTPGGTVDGLHLSNTGHTLLAQELSEMFVPTE